MAKIKKQSLTPEERLEQALVPDWEHPYKVPGNWIWTRLGDYIDHATDYVANGSFASLKSNVAYYKYDNYALMVKTQDFSSNFSEALTFTDKRGYDFLKKSALFGGELILSNIGSIGKVFRVPFLNRPMTLAPNSIMIKCYDNSHYDYLYYLLLSPLGTDLLLAISSGTAVKKFNKTDLKTISIPIPPLGEQMRIVAHIESLFEKLDRAQELVQSALDSFETRKAAILHKAFSGELTKEWRNVNVDKLTSYDTECIVRNDLNLFDLPSSWAWVNLEHLMNKKEYCYGVIQPGEDFEDGPRLIRVCNLINGTVDVENLRGISNEIHNQYKRSILKGGEILVSVVGTIGRTAIAPDECSGYNIARAIAKISIRNFNAKYIYYWLNTGIAQTWLVAEAREVARKTLNLEQLKTIPVPIPTPFEQHEIVRILDDLFEKEQQAKELCEVIGKIDLIKKSILARAFRGELGTNDPNEESAVELLKDILGAKL